jgi:DNA-binding response OmpR family regulator
MEQYVPLNKPKVLVLDEDLLSLELYYRELGDSYQVITCETVTETRQHLRDNLLDAVIIEPAVNDGEGWVLLSEIRISQNPPLVVLCSVEDDRKVGLERGALAYVVKPVLPTELHALLDNALAKRSANNAQRLEKGT